MRERDERHLDAMTGLGVVAVLAVVGWAHFGGVDVAPETVRVDTVRATPTCSSVRSALRQRSAQLARTHHLLTLHRERLRRLGHVYSDGRWVRVGR